MALSRTIFGLFAYTYVFSLFTCCFAGRGLAGVVLGADRGARAASRWRVAAGLRRRAMVYVSHIALCFAWIHYLACLLTLAGIYVI
jgi:hypothetical protein